MLPRWPPPKFTSACVLAIQLALLATHSYTAQATVIAPSSNQTVDDLMESLILTKYTRFHQQNRHTANRVILRFNTTQPGLGDRLGTLMAVFVMASFTNRIFIIDWIEPYSLSTFFLQNKLNVMYDPVRDADPHAYQCTGSLKCPALDLGPLLGSRRTIIVEPGIRTGLRVPIAHPGIFQKLITTFPRTRIALQLKPYMRYVPPSSYSLFSKIFTTLFRPSPALQNHLNEYSYQTRLGYISIHARLGRGVRENGPRFLSDSNLTLPEIAVCFVNAAMRARQQDDRLANIRFFYLATDTTDFRPVFEKVLRHRIPGGALIKPLREFNPVHTALCNREHSMDCMHTVGELLLLSKGETVISNPSAFSRVAALVGNIHIAEYIRFDKCPLYAM